MTTSPDQEAGAIAGPGPIKAYRRYWFPELIALILLAVGTIILFSSTNLDISSLHPFYRQSSSDPWSRGNEPLWSLLYRSAPWVTGSLAVVGTVLVVIGLLRDESKSVRVYGFFILLCVAIGPGLIVNVALKDHWGRPRPRQIIEFGGKFAYVQPLVPAEARGKSFPCGHCSVGYLYAVGWWVWRRRHPRWALLSLIAGRDTRHPPRPRPHGDRCSFSVRCGLVSIDRFKHCPYSLLLRAQDSRPGGFPGNTVPAA